MQAIKQTEGKGASTVSKSGATTHSRVSAPFFQPKPTVNTTGDAHEREADAVADQVMRMRQGDAPIVQRMPITPVSSVQRACANCAHEKEKEGVQRKETGGGDAGGKAAPSIVSDVLSSGGGQPMDGGTKQFMENRFGQDFSQVRIHTNPKASESAQAIQARAYTSGRDVVFGQGEYQPDSESGKRLLAHELVHVGQQGEGQRAVQRTRSPRQGCTADPNGDFIRLIVVNQETPQQVSVFWNSGRTESDICSTGKGGCCIPDGAPDNQVGCDRTRSNTPNTACTPIGVHTVNLILPQSSSGVQWWTQFTGSDRQIALHEYTPVDGTPLSHGCVRLNHDMAFKIYCGSIAGTTRVEVRGFARPRCNHPQLESEWLGDFSTAADRDGDSHVQYERKNLIQFLGIEQRRSRINAQDQDALDTQIAGMQTPQGDFIPARAQAAIPRCTGTSNLDIETERLQRPAANARVNTSFLTAFRGALGGIRRYSDASTVIRQQGINLWTVSHPSPAGGDIDDRPLYWTRLAALREIEQWTPAFSGLSTSRRAALKQLFESSSRGQNTADFNVREGVKRILLTGFDPFNLDVNIDNNNPSGALALSLDGFEVTNGSTVIGQIQTATFPVRFRDFNEGQIESFFASYITGPQAVDMILTTSWHQGPPEIENQAGSGRTTTVPDNLGLNGGTGANNIRIPGTAGGPEFYASTLPDSVESGTGLGRDTTSHQAGTAGVANRGTGGAYLSNEIYYRVHHLHAQGLSSGQLSRTIPIAHIHIPFFGGAYTETTVRNSVLQLIRQTFPLTGAQQRPDQ